MRDTEKITWIANRLIATYGRVSVDLLDPVENLILTILSQNTHDVNRDRAFQSLMQEFETLKNVSAAPIEQIAATIQIGGLQQQKARSIHAALGRILDVRGVLDLSFLNDLALPEALSWLLNLPGVGPKTASIVLLFSFDRPAFPADTHIRRVMSRLGLISERGDPHPRLNQLLPPDAPLMQQLHLLTIRLGREICHPRQPCCDSCPLNPECMWIAQHGSTRKDGVTSRTDEGGLHQ